MGIARYFSGKRSRSIACAFNRNSICVCIEFRCYRAAVCIKNAIVIAAAGLTHCYFRCYHATFGQSAVGMGCGGAAVFQGKGRLAVSGVDRDIRAGNHITVEIDGNVLFTQIQCA